MNARETEALAAASMTEKKKISPSISPSTKRPSAKVVSSGQNIELLFEQMPVEKQAYLTRLLEVCNSNQTLHTSHGANSTMQAPALNKSHRLSNSPSTKPQFRFHKNLATSRYEEFLAESDDEDFFKSKPKTKDGRNYELDFKIDTYRDQIKFNKNGSQKKLISARPSAVGSATGFINV